MSEQPSYFAFCCTYLVFLFILVKFIKIIKVLKSETKLPPGPWRLPIIGNLHQLLISSDLPHHCLSKLAKKHGPIMYLKLGERSATIISSSSGAEAKYKTYELNFAQRPTVLAAKIAAYGESGIIYAPYGDYWRQTRKFCIMKLLSIKRVKSFKSIREEEVQSVIQSFSASSSKCVINLSDTFSVLTTSITSRAAFGNKCKDAKEFIDVLYESLALGGGFYMLDYFPILRFLPFIGGMKSKLQKLHVRMDKILDNIVNEHKEKRFNNHSSSKEKDLIDVLLNWEESNDDIRVPISPTNIKGIIFEIFGAGTETSATTMEWAMSELLKNPRVMQKAQDEVRQVFGTKKNVKEEDIIELQYLKIVIKETLRLHPPLPLLIRECIEKCEIQGYDIPTKSKVIVNFWAIGRDPQHWSDVDCFIPERFEDSNHDYKGTNFEYIPFGAGRRICPGILFANATIEYSLALLLYYFDWSLPDDLEPDKLDMTEAFGMTVKRKNALLVIANPSSSNT